MALTAKDQARTVAHEAREQTRHVLHQLRRHTDEQARHQSRRAAGTIRQWTGELEAIGDNAQPDSPMRSVVQQVAERGHRAADYLETEGLQGAVRDVQDFARRRPGLFLAGAVVAGFLVGRAVKAVASAEDPHANGPVNGPAVGPAVGTADGDARWSDSGTAYGSGYGSASGDGSGAAYGSGSPSSAPYGTRPVTTYGTGTRHTVAGEPVSGSTGTGGPGTGVTPSPSYGTGNGNGTGDGYRAGGGHRTGDVTRNGTGTGYTTGARYPSDEIRDSRADDGRGDSDGFPGAPGAGGEPR
ncbi:hypothetical protein [Microbispora sp. H13382]|uniref:hypothetical protein n=1 Tax=Microbispora sp. H13382 TaxID=2729112 RepID=UPI001600789A